MSIDEFEIRIEILSAKMGARAFHAPSWNNPTPQEMVPDDSFVSQQLCLLKDLPPAQAMKCANELWEQANK